MVLELIFSLGKGGLGQWSWFIVCVNLTGSQDAQRSGEALFLGVPVGVFLEGIST